MLKIKLVRFGRRNQPHYRIVVQEARTKRDGKYTALVGHYGPTQTPKLLEIDLQSYQAWIERGAQPTRTVAGLVKRFQSDQPFPPKKKRSKKEKAVKKLEGKEASAKANRRRKQAKR